MNNRREDAIRRIREEHKFECESLYHHLEAQDFRMLLLEKRINFNEIVILNKKSGKPYISLKGKTKKIIEDKLKNKKTKISLSLSDEKDYAVAFVTISI